MEYEATMPEAFRSDPLSKTIFGLSISNSSKESALAGLQEALKSRSHRKIAFCNAHTANLAWIDAAFRETLSRFTIFPDGVGIDMAARALHGSKFAANLNGTDFVPALLRETTMPLRIGLIGARPGVAVAAATALSDQATHHHYGPLLHGFESESAVRAFLDGLQKSPVDILLVAMGNPRQEHWIAQNITAQHASLAIGVGALFDFLAGHVTRAPAWVRNARLEWLYRLFQEPKRLFRRYILGNPLFLMRVAMVRLGLRRF